MPLSTFAQNLRIARNNMGWSQRQAADACGVKLSTYQAYEEGRAEPCHDILLKIATAYGVEDLKGFIGDAKFYAREGTRESTIIFKHLGALPPEALRAMLSFLRAL